MVVVSPPRLSASASATTTATVTDANANVNADADANTNADMDADADAAATRLGAKRAAVWTRTSDDVNGRGRREEEKTAALCGAGNLASTWCEGEGSSLCVSLSVILE